MESNMKNTIVLFANSNLSNTEKCLAWKNGQWGFVAHGPVARHITSSTYGWTRVFTPIYWGASVGEKISIGEFTSVIVRNPQPTLSGTYFGAPTGCI